MLRFIGFGFNGLSGRGGARSILLLAGLLVTATAWAQPRQVNDTEVSSCRLLGRVSGDSGYGKNNDWRVIAKYKALQRAEQLGASELVWDRFTSVGAFNGQVEARAYACNVRVAQRTENAEK